VIVDRYLEQVDEVVESTLGTAADPVSGIGEYFRLLRELGEADSFAAGCLIGNLCAEATGSSALLRELLAVALHTWRVLIAAAVDRARAGGQIAADGSPGELVAALLIDAWQGALLRAKAERSPAALDAFIAVTLAALLGDAA
jgi:TetR/AcrR family transcriptional repressor of nem operon